VRRLVIELLDHKRTHTTERLFRLLGLRYPREDFRRIWRGLHAGPRDRASSRELLENAVPPPRRAAVAALFDDVDDDRRLAAGAGWHRPSALTGEDLLQDILQQGSLPLRALVAYHVGELGLVDLRADVARLRDEAIEEMRATFQDAVDMLDDPGREKAFVVQIR
jgi:hypothetical protein